MFMFTNLYGGVDKKSSSDCRWLFMESVFAVAFWKPSADLTVALKRRDGSQGAKLIESTKSNK